MGKDARPNLLDTRRSRHLSSSRICRKVLSKGLLLVQSLARFGPTTPKHRARDLRASVDQNDAR